MFTTFSDEGLGCVTPGPALGGSGRGQARVREPPSRCQGVCPAVLVSSRATMLASTASGCFLGNVERSVSSGAGLALSAFGSALLRSTERALHRSAPPALTCTRPQGRPDRVQSERHVPFTHWPWVVHDVCMADRNANTAALRAAQRGDEYGFRLLYRDLQPQLLRYLRVLVGDDAEDVASEAWLQISRDFASFAGDLDDFRGWASTIARNRALDQLRRQRRRPPTTELPDAEAHLPAEQDTAQLALDAIGLNTALALIAELPPDQAEAVLLRVVVGLDNKSVAHILGKRPGAVRTATYRGLNKLAERLDKLGDRRTRPTIDVTLSGPPTLWELR